MCFQSMYVFGKCITTAEIHLGEHHSDLLPADLRRLHMLSAHTLVIITE